MQSIRKLFHSQGVVRAKIPQLLTNFVKPSEHISGKLPQLSKFDSPKVKHPGSPRLKQEEVVTNSEVTGGNKAIGEESKGVQENKHSETLGGHGKVEEGSANKDEKGMRIFKNALVELVKEILKPTWKEGRMSREVHKTVVKKVVDKVSSTIQVDHIPKTQDKAEQYLSNSKPKITKLVQAYVERCRKADS
ncbi:UNVERIFIED_CONTAM: Zinc finger CCCH domain-containing protein 38 [Sesamum latifolium]|uniref:Zinc finger CCCH domain-containing protein 38 n=1 Tax=Sesamum latifolium TaxID=2727402 RepID=A0AAW2WDD0_9LAMI